jgi:hypothetical protein
MRIHKCVTATTLVVDSDFKIILVFNGALIFRGAMLDNRKISHLTDKKNEKHHLVRRSDWISLYPLPREGTVVYKFLYGKCQHI